jgi:hypothetical protein
MSTDLHVLPAGDLVDHDERRDCFCWPEVVAVCPECGERDDPTGCWRCDERGVLPREDAPEAPVMVIHNALDGRA